MRDVLEDIIPSLGHKALLWINGAVLLVKLLRKIKEEHGWREREITRVIENLLSTEGTLYWLVVYIGSG